MTTRAVVGLAIVAAALGAFLVIDARRHPGGTDQNAAARARLVPPFDREGVQRISLRRARGEAFALVHAPSPIAPAPAPAWRIETAARSAAADDAAVQELLGAVDLTESERIVEMSADEAGLQPPVVEIALQTAAQNVSTLQLGRPDAAGRGVYARAGTAGPIRVIGRRVLELADRDPSAFRDRRLLPIDPATVTAIEWRLLVGGSELRAVGGRWQNGRKEWVDDRRVVELLRRLFALRIDRFDVSHSRTVALPEEVTVVAGATRILLTVEAGDAAGEVTRGGERLHVPPDAIAAALQALAAAEARDARLIAMPPDAVTRVDLFDDDARVGLRRVNGAWAFSTPKLNYGADTAAVDAWLARLGAITVATRAAGPRMRHLILDGRFRQEIAVSSPPDVYALLAPDPLRFRERALLSFAHFDVRGVRRTSGKEPAQALTTDDGAGWRSPSGGQADAANLARVVGALSDLHAEAFLPSAPAGDAAVKLEIDVQAPGEPLATKHAVQIWAQKGGGCIARLDTGTTFKPERSTCETLRLDLLKKP